MTIELQEEREHVPEQLTIGVLALQGAFHEHIAYLNRLRPKGHTIRAIAVRTKDELDQCYALILPGGESTAITRVAARTEGLLPALQAFVADPNRPVYGTCAGMILMAEPDGVGGGKRQGDGKAWGGIRGMKVWRNLYGGQLESFEYPLAIPSLFSLPDEPFNTIFIRAPCLHSLSPSARAETEILASLPPECIPAPPPADSPLGPADEETLGAVMLRQGRKLVTSFHPELSGDARIHEFWVEREMLGGEGY
ncbi:pyridoxine metabolism-related protein [Trichosporon asahii var. asahii CBS 8904]|uniref:glutaminase n=1 Tax=Trichosporon asahii var. asahii (strain CBS 8904) TaxID=1220162 RepID=K1VGR2_TRIAC|nr:pyridoxine metabolism-related protein [Trichosporon asahii var. asahii CBS 8904]